MDGNWNLEYPALQYIPRNMHTVFALLCFVVVIHGLIFPYPSGLLHWHCGNLTIAPVPAKQPWCVWINTSCEFIMNDCITTTKQSTTKSCAYFLGYTVSLALWSEVCNSVQICWSFLWLNWLILLSPGINEYNIWRYFARIYYIMYKTRLGVSAPAMHGTRCEVDGGDPAWSCLLITIKSTHSLLYRLNKLALGFIIRYSTWSIGAGSWYRKYFVWCSWFGHFT